MNHTKEEVLKHLTQDLYCRLGVSTVEGVGVFAIRPIPKGIKPLRVDVDTGHELLTHEEVETLPKGVQDQIYKFCYYDEDHVQVPRIGLNAVRLGVYLNHSKKPNVQYEEDGELVSLRAIKTGEELFLDYDENFGDTHIFD